MLFRSKQCDNSTKAIESQAGRIVEYQKKAQQLEQDLVTVKEQLETERRNSEILRSELESIRTPVVSN